MEDLYANSFSRNIGVISEKEQEALRNSRVTIVGVGGVGGIAAIQCARMGIGTMHIIENDEFEASNLNRQMLSFVSRLGHPKAKVAEEMVKDINPSARITTSQEWITEENADRLLDGSDIVIDATDNLVTRVIIHRAAYRLGIPSVWIAVTPPFRGGVMTFTPDAEPYEVVLRHPSHGLELTEDVRRAISAIKNERALYSVKMGASMDWADQYVQGKCAWTVMSPVANIVGILASFEAFKMIVKRPGLEPAVAPQLVRVDLADTEMVKRLVPTEGTWDNATL